MKLLLTSSGLTNTSITKSLSELLDKPFKDATLTFIPTAANIEPGGKEWLIDDLQKFKDLQFKEMDIVDISALSKERWLPRIEKADILVFGGGNAYYLMHWLIKSGLKEVLPTMLKDKVYVGISAGSMVTTTNFYPTFNHDVGLYNEEVISENEIKYGLELVNFHIIPHLNTDIFPKVRIPNIEKYAAKTQDTLYAIDDATAIKVIDDKIEIISEGEWEKFNTKEL